ncbi:hypothetical protein FHS16_003740 [Paenibacillus endophyticus]|uniref:Uncharacterized protein n=1 Tax=Paenibacillus endophyticus TaxID=1294268 RepID=A0A7W5C9M9_9BACL|nr:hypothetical protein [Paenibacillus endophyticus]MBB3153665.1 hypothetical protein [Paenibacillus endophyticus]
MEFENTKNLYVNAWFLSPEEIERLLSSLTTPWKRISNQFFFLVTANNCNEVLFSTREVNLANGSMIHESNIEYVQNSPEEVENLLNEIYSQANIILF